LRFPQFAVSKWIGHSIIVSGKHYANAVPDELFDKAVGGGAACETVLSATRLIASHAGPSPAE